MLDAQFINALESALIFLDTKASGKQFDLMHSHYQALLRYKKVLNLTALETPEKIAYNLFADSLVPLGLIRMVNNPRILDIGSGGGFPSIPLRIMSESTVEFVIVERRERAVFFLEELISSLKLTNIEVVNDRIENLKNSERFAESFDFAMNKAAFHGDTFLDMSFPFLKSRGYAVHWTTTPILDSDLPPGWLYSEKIELQSRELFPGSVAVYRKK